jgi:hypothetical protein
MGAAGGGLVPLAASSAASMKAATFSAAARCGSENKCEYLFAVAELAWPNREAINGNEAPLETSTLA